MADNSINYGPATYYANCPVSLPWVIGGVNQPAPKAPYMPRKQPAQKPKEMAFNRIHSNKVKKIKITFV